MEEWPEQRATRAYPRSTLRQRLTEEGRVTGELGMVKKNDGITSWVGHACVWWQDGLDSC